MVARGPHLEGAFKDCLTLRSPSSHLKGRLAVEHRQLVTWRGGVSEEGGALCWVSWEVKKRRGLYGEDYFEDVVVKRR